MSEIMPINCKECGGKPCICTDGFARWAAHCMECDNAIGKPGYYDPCAESEEEAIKMWNNLNKPTGKVDNEETVIQ